MDTETLWILKKLSAKEISAESADRILRALELLRRSEKDKALTTAERKPVVIQSNVSSTEETEMPVVGNGDEHSESQQQEVIEEVSIDAEPPPSEVGIDAEELPQETEPENEIASQELDLVTETEDEPADIEETEEIEEAEEIRETEEIEETEESPQENTIWAETVNEKPLLGNDGMGIIEDILDGTEMILEKTGDVVIHGWDQAHIKAEGEADSSSTFLRTGKNLKIGSENGVVLYIPRAVEEVSIASGSGSIDIRNYLNDIAIDSDTGSIKISEASGTIIVNSIEGDITLEKCCGEISLESELGDIIFSGTPVEEKEDVDLLVSKTEEVLAVKEVKIEAGAGDVVLSGISGDIDVKANSGKISLERCRGQNISVESSGGNIMLRDMADNMSLKNEGGSITMEDFSGAVNVKSQNTEVFLKNSGDAEIHIESNDGDIAIEDCYADVYIDSGVGDVLISGGNLSFGGMGKVELKMKAGDAYLHRRTFEDVRIVIEEGNATVNMEKLNFGGAGRISVYRGNITIGVSPSFGCELTVHGSRKKMHMELPVEIMEKDKNRLQGVLNGGGSKMEIIAPNGEIRFHDLNSLDMQSNIENANIDQ